MLENLLFLAMLFGGFVIVAVVILFVDLCLYAFFGKSYLFALEKWLFDNDRNGHGY